MHNGGKEIFCYNEKERIAALKKLGKGAAVQRYKGLGEMNPDQLRVTTLMPGNERLVRVSIDDAHQAMQYVNLLMGNSSRDRKSWIMEAWEQEA